VRAVKAYSAILSGKRRNSGALLVHVEDVFDDGLDLPENLPGHVKYVGIRRKPSSRNISK
jgi:hypothetical protein